jgi:hypothetical protein
MSEALVVGVVRQAIETAIVVRIAVAEVGRPTTSCGIA